MNGLACLVRRSGATSLSMRSTWWRSSSVEFGQRHDNGVDTSTRAPHEAHLNPRTIGGTALGLARGSDEAVMLIGGAPRRSFSLRRDD
jgi:hypothetical protein